MILNDEAIHRDSKDFDDCKEFDDFYGSFFCNLVVLRLKIHLHFYLLRLRIALCIHLLVQHNTSDAQADFNIFEKLKRQKKYYCHKWDLNTRPPAFA